MAKNIELGLSNLIRHWRELAKFSKISGSDLVKALNHEQTLPPGVRNKHDYWRGVADALNQASIQAEALLNDSDDAPSTSGAS